MECQRVRSILQDFGNGVLHGVREDSQSVGECMNQNVIDMKFGEVDPQMQFNRGLNVAEGTAAILLGARLHTHASRAKCTAWT
jgi:hypothetical protein